MKFGHSQSLILGRNVREEFKNLLGYGKIEKSNRLGPKKRYRHWSHIFKQVRCYKISDFDAS